MDNDIASDSFAPPVRPSSLSVLRSSASTRRSGTEKRSLSVVSQPDPRMSHCSDVPHYSTSRPIVETGRSGTYAKSKLTQIAQDKLNFSRLGLVGRDKEQRILQQALARVVRSCDGMAASAHGSKSEGSNESTGSAVVVDGDNDDAQNVRCFVSISGYSGTGKSTLAASLRPKCVLHNAFFVVGKFDLKQTEEPFSGFKSAMADLCAQIVGLPRVESSLPQNATPGRRTVSASSRDPRRFEHLRDAIIKAFDVDELRSLIQVVPGIVDVVGSNILLSSSSTRPEYSNGTADSYNPSSTRTDGQKPISIDPPAQQRQQQQQQEISFREQSDRFKFVFRKFVQVVCQYCPLVWVSDDVQWADKASLNIIESLMTDVSISSLMVVACFRSNAMQPPQSNPDHLQQMLESICRSKQERSIRVTQLELDNLPAQHIHVMLLELLCGSLSDTGTAQCRRLADIVHRRTGGNVFFVQQFLRMLVSQEMLAYNVGTLQWKWNNDDIERQTSATMNVAELMQSKLRQIGPVRLVLPIAACLGATFSASLLWHALRRFAEPSVGNDDCLTFYERLFDGGPPKTREEFDEVVQVCCDEGLIERLSSMSDDKLGDDSATDRMYSFVHDKVQEAALQLIPDEAMAEMQHRVGIILARSLDGKALQESLFVVVNLINVRLDLLPPYPQGTDDSASCVRFKMAELNHMAASKAVASAAFSAALSYCKAAMHLLPIDCWTTHRAMSLDLYTSATECAFVASKRDDMQRFGQIVIELDCTILDKMRVYHILMDASLGSDDPEVARGSLELGRSVLKEFGYQFPRSKFVKTVASLTGLLRMKRSMAKWTSHVVDELPHVDDVIESAVMKTLDKLTTAAYLLDPDLMPMVILHSVKRTFKRGITPTSPVAMAILGLVLGPVLGFLENARVCANHAMDMVHRMPTRSSEARVYLCCHSFLFHFSQPFENSIEPLLTGYRSGMATGDIESALWCMYSHLLFCFQTGRSLTALEKDFSTYYKLSKDFKQMKHAEVYSMVWQMTLNLIGASRERTVLSGDAYDEHKAYSKYVEANDAWTRGAFWRFKMFTAVFFSNYDAAADIAVEEMEQGLSSAPGAVDTVPTYFFGAFACYIASSPKLTAATGAGSSKRKTTGRMRRRTAAKARRRIQELANKGNPNCSHYLDMLAAERSITKDRDFERLGSSEPHPFVSGYQKAIRLMARRGLVHEQAMANERLCDFYVYLAGDTSSARFHFDQSVRLYTEWGAHGKVAALEERGQQVWPPPTEINITH